jgi:hypothetical protein
MVLNNLCVWGIYPQCVVLKSHLSHNEFLEHTKQTKSVIDTRFCIFISFCILDFDSCQDKVSTLYDVKDLHECFHVCDFVNFNNVEQ